MKSRSSVQGSLLFVSTNIFQPISHACDACFYSVKCNFAKVQSIHFAKLEPTNSQSNRAVPPHLAGSLRPPFPASVSTRTGDVLEPYTFSTPSIAFGFQFSTTGSNVRIPRTAAKSTADDIKFRQGRQEQNPGICLLSRDWVMWVLQGKIRKGLVRVCALCKGYFLEIRGCPIDNDGK